MQINSSTSTPGFRIGYDGSRTDAQNAQGGGDRARDGYFLQVSTFFGYPSSLIVAAGQNHFSGRGGYCFEQNIFFALVCLHLIQGDKLRLVSCAD